MKRLPFEAEIAVAAGAMIAALIALPMVMPPKPQQPQALISSTAASLAVRLPGDRCMNIAGRDLCTPEWAFISVPLESAPGADRCIVVDSGATATTGRMVYESEVRDGANVVLPVLANGKMRSRISGVGCIYPSDCSAIDVSAIPVGSGKRRAVTP